MPQGLPFLQQREILPLFAHRSPPPANVFVRLSRVWRSLHRIQRTALIGVAAFTVLCLFYLQLVSLSTQVENAYHHSAVINNEQHNDKRKPLSVHNQTRDNNSSVSLGFGAFNDRQRAVRNAFKHAWTGYKKYAWGHDHLKPISKSSSEWMGCGLTIVDSLDTMILMDLKDEFNDARKWVVEKLTFDVDNFVNLFETTIRVLGGLLSAFHLTSDETFKWKALDIGNRLIGALSSQTAIPFSDVNLKTLEGKEPGGESSLSEVTSIQLEFRDLTRITGNQTFEKSAFRISEHIHELGCSNHDGLCEMFLSPTTGNFRKATTITFGARADSYYEYLLKQYLQTGKTIPWLLKDYEQAMTTMEKKLFRYTQPNNYGFVGELLGGDTFSPKMDHLACFLAGTLAMGVMYAEQPQAHLEIAKNLSRTCYEMYRTPTGLAPEIMYGNMLPGKKEDIIIKPLDAHSLLRPEAFEAWFYMYRATGDKMYQDWGWQAFEAIEKYAKVENGYSSINNCKKIPPTYRDMMESFFLSETLKYLFLLFDDSRSQLPLNQWVFNTEGHPLPIRQS
ncbi:hypothetical protein M3Y94_00791500 [Aphelenchoides besseyi]|nr:hypothetical protein M3Y94_00791500 [Aphelenchoides besseyi]KAI6232454.1 Alpha-1,2-Mannosidase [Aphelenchoides besseyi]